MDELILYCYTWSFKILSGLTTDIGGADAEWRLHDRETPWVMGVGDLVASKMGHKTEPVAERVSFTEPGRGDWCH